MVPDMPQMDGEPPYATKDRLTTLLYLLIRDGKVAPGDLEQITCELETEVSVPREDPSILLSNRYLAEYAEQIVRRLTRLSRDSQAT